MVILLITFFFLKLLLEELYAKQNLTKDQPEKLICDEICEKYGYGFAWKRHGVLGNFREEIGDLFDIKNPETSLIEKRVQKCFEYDKMKFNPAYYL